MLFISESPQSILASSVPHNIGIIGDGSLPAIAVEVKVSGWQLGAKPPKEMPEAHSMRMEMKKMQFEISGNAKISESVHGQNS